MAIHTGTAANFSALTTSNKVVLVDYWADWCSPCKQLTPLLEELAAEYADQLDIVKVDTNAEPALAAQQGIMSLPTLHFYAGGELAKSLQGGQTKRQLTKIIESLV